MWSTCVRIDHLLGVPVIGCDEGSAMRLSDPFSDPTQTGVDALTGRDRWLGFSGMTKHGGICKVDYEYVVFSLVYSSQDFIRDLECRHFRFEIVGSDLRRRHKQPTF